MPTATKAKLSVTELSAIYDRIYDIADRLIKKHNPCNIHIKNNKVYCTCKIHTKHRQKHLCCNSISDGVCKYWSNGCNVKCLPCKLFVCTSILYKTNRKYSNFVHRLEWLREIAIKYGIVTHAYFNTKKEVLDTSIKG